MNCRTHEHRRFERTLRSLGLCPGSRSTEGRLIPLCVREHSSRDSASVGRSVQGAAHESAGTNLEHRRSAWLRRRHSRSTSANPSPEKCPLTSRCSSPEGGRTRGKQIGFGRHAESEVLCAKLWRKLRLRDHGRGGSKLQGARTEYTKHSGRGRANRPLLTTCPVLYARRSCRLA